MCRSIKTLRSSETPATNDEMQAAALQFVRKVSGYRTPSWANADAFNRAVETSPRRHECCCRRWFRLYPHPSPLPSRERGTAKAMVKSPDIRAW